MFKDILLIAGGFVFGALFFRNNPTTGESWISKIQAWFKKLLNK